MSKNFRRTARSGLLFFIPKSRLCLSNKRHNKKTMSKTTTNNMKDTITTSQKTENYVPMEDQPLSSFPWVAFNTGYNSLEEVAEVYRLPLSVLKTMVESKKRSRKKVITGVIMELRRTPLLYKGQLYTKKAFAELTGIPYSTVQSRWKRGWSAERIATTPLLAEREIKTYHVNGKDYFGMQELAKAFHMSAATIQMRLKKGMTAEQAVTIPVRKPAKEAELFLCCGKEVRSYAEACQMFDVSYHTFCGRRNRNPKKRPDDIILELAHKPAMEYVVYGVGYKTLRAAAIGNQVTPEKLYARIYNNTFPTIEAAIEDIKNSKYIVFGKKYNSINAIAAEYGVTAYKLRSRFAKTGDIEKAIRILTGGDESRYYIDGKGYNNAREVAEAYSLSYKSLQYYMAKHDGDIEAAIKDMQNPERKRNQIAKEK